MREKAIHDTIEVIARGSAFFLLSGFGDWVHFGICLLAAFLWSWADNINKMHK